MSDLWISNIEKAGALLDELAYAVQNENWSAAFLHMQAFELLTSAMQKQFAVAVPDDDLLVKLDALDDKRRQLLLAFTHRKDETLHTLSIFGQQQRASSAYQRVDDQ